MPQNANMIATKTPFGDVLVFDYQKHPTLPESTEVCKPNLRLKGNTEDGYALDWNSNKKGLRISINSRIIFFKFLHFILLSIFYIDCKFIKFSLFVFIL